MTALDELQLKSYLCTQVACGIEVENIVTNIPKTTTRENLSSVALGVFRKSLNLPVWEKIKHHH